VWLCGQGRLHFIKHQPGDLNKTARLQRAYQIASLCLRLSCLTGVHSDTMFIGLSMQALGAESAVAARLFEGVEM
jgi:hypothetical protein